MKKIYLSVGVGVRVKRKGSRHYDQRGTILSVTHNGYAFIQLESWDVTVYHYSSLEALTVPANKIKEFVNV